MENTAEKFARKGKLKVVKGTILLPQNGGLRMVLNPIAMTQVQSGALFDLFDKKWRQVRAEAKGWFASRENFKLGVVKDVAVQSDVWVMNMLVKDKDGKFDEKALEAAFKSILKTALFEKATVHVSSITMDESPEMVPFVESLMAKGVSVCTYDE
jgi:hypothetical protein